MGIVSTEVIQVSKKNHTPQASADPGGWPLIRSFQGELNRMFDRFGTGPIGGDHRVMPVRSAKPGGAIGTARKIDITGT